VNITDHLYRSRTVKMVYFPEMFSPTHLSFVVVRLIPISDHFLRGQLVQTMVTEAWKRACEKIVLQKFSVSKAGRIVSLKMRNK
jgi:hypothetical protein